MPCNQWTPWQEAALNTCSYQKSHQLDTTPLFYWQSCTSDHSEEKLQSLVITPPHWTPRLVLRNQLLFLSLGLWTWPPCFIHLPLLPHAGMSAHTVGSCSAFWDIKVQIHSWERKRVVTAAWKALLWWNRTATPSCKTSASISCFHRKPFLTPWKMKSCLHVTTTIHFREAEGWQARLWHLKRLCNESSMK